MQWLNNPFVFPLLIAGSISIVNALVVAQRRRVTGSLPLLGMLISDRLVVVYLRIRACQLSAELGVILVKDGIYRDCERARVLSPFCV